MKINPLPIEFLGCKKTSWALLFNFARGILKFYTFTVMLGTSMEVHISPTIPKPLFFALLERLLQNGWQPTMTEEAHASIPSQDWKFYGIDPNMVLSRQIELAQAFISMRSDQIPEGVNGNNFLISLDKSIEKSQKNTVIFQIHDLLAYDTSLPLFETIHHWKDSIEVESDDQAYYWVSPRDVSDAIVTCLSIQSLPDIIEICGRRGWSIEDTQSEFSVLFSRWNQSKSGEIRHESLQNKELPLMIQAYTGTPPNRPNLEPLHEILLQKRQDGWRPYVPLRTMLMELIASIEKM